MCKRSQCCGVLLVLFLAFNLAANAQDSQDFSKPKMISSSAKYKNSGLQPATGFADPSDVLKPNDLRATGRFVPTSKF